MAEGFLKGLWGKPATAGTGVMGLWGTITSVPKKVIGSIMSPFKFITYLIVGVILIILYGRLKK